MTVGRVSCAAAPAAIVVTAASRALAHWPADPAHGAAAGLIG